MRANGDPAATAFLPPSSSSVHVEFVAGRNSLTLNEPCNTSATSKVSLDESSQEYILSVDSHYFGRVVKTCYKLCDFVYVEI